MPPRSRGRIEPPTGAGAVERRRQQAGQDVLAEAVTACEACEEASVVACCPHLPCANLQPQCPAALQAILFHSAGQWGSALPGHRDPATDTPFPPTLAGDGQRPLAIRR